MPNMRLVQLDIWIDILLVAYNSIIGLYIIYTIYWLTRLIKVTVNGKLIFSWKKNFRCNFPALAWIFAQMIYYASDAEFKWFALHKQDQCAHSAYNNIGYIDTKTRVLTYPRLYDL